MAYRDDLTALGANHLWVLDGNVNDTIGSLNLTNSGGVFTGPQICEDVSTSYTTNGTADTATAASDSSVQDVTQDYCYSVWFRTTAIQQPPCRVLGDGGQTVNNSFLLGFGNSIVCEADCDPTVIQVGSATALEANRSYNLALVFRDIGGGSSQLEFFLDGVSQGTQDVADIMNSGRGGFAIGGATNTSAYSIGGSAFQLVSPVNGNYAMFATFVNANVPTNTEIREEIFEKGALPGTTIPFTDQATMQTALDAIASTVRPDEPLNIRIEGDTAGVTPTDTGLTTGVDIRTALRIGDAGWAGSANITTNNDSYATTSVSNNPSTSDSIDVTNFGFSSVVGASDTIDGVEVTVRARSTAGTHHNIGEVFLVINDVAQTTEIKSDAALLGTTEAVYTFGGPTDLWSLGSISAADVRGVNFGAGLAIGNNVGLQFGTDTAEIDSIEITVYYTPASGGSATDITLTADNITHDGLASCHIQWTGEGALTYINNNGSNASIGSTPNGGTLTFVNPATLTVAPLIADSEVRFYEAGTTTEIAGIETSGTSFASSVNVSSVDIVIHKEDYENLRINAVDMSGGDVSVPIQQIFDRQYESP